MLLAQNGLCLICERHPQRPVLDHHHKKRIGGTGLVRGVLCNSCNIFLAKSENNCVRFRILQQDLPRILRGMAAYLEREHINYLHPSERPRDPKLTRRSYNQLKKIHGGSTPSYPFRGKLTIALRKLFKKYNIEPMFYGS